MRVSDNYEFLIDFFFHFYTPVVLNDIKFEHLRRLVEYLYCGKTKIKASELDEFFLAVKRFKILGLSDLPIEAQNTNRTPHKPSVSGVHCSMTYELSSCDDDDDEHNQTGEPGQHGTKRKINENQNKSFSQLRKASRKSIPNISTRTCTLPEQPVNGNGSQQPPMAEKLPVNNSPSVEKTTTDQNETEKHATPSNSKSANGK